MKIIISRTTVEIGGAEISAIDHANLAADRGDEVVFVSNCRPIEERLNKSVAFHTLPWLHKEKFKTILFPIRFIFALIKAVFILIRFRPDVVNSHSRDDQILFTLLRPFFGYRVVWKNPGDLRFALKGGTRQNIIATLYEKLLIRMLRQADVVYSLNNDDTEQLQKLTKDRRTFCTTIPSDMLFDSYDIEAQPLEKSSKVIGSIIRLSDEKGVGTLVTAFSKVPEDWELWLVGDGPHRQLLEDRVEELFLTNRVKFWGFQSSVSKFYRSFDIFVQPSLHEPWGRNIKEAKYFGLPIIGSATGGIKIQLSDKSGLLFTPNNPDELAEKINLLTSDASLRKVLGKKARRSALAEGDFTKKFQEQILPLLEGKR